MQNSDSGSVEYQRTFEHLDKPFEISKGIFVPVGGYNYERVSAIYVFGPQRPVSGTISARQGSFYEGHRTEAEYSGNVKFGSRLTLEPRVSFNWIDLPQGSFTTRLVSTRASLPFSPRMIFGALVQYNTSNQTLAANLRFHWEYQPGSDFFVVFNEGRDTVGAYDVQNRSFTVKLTRLLRF
jgi:hypothetical protein